MFTGVIEEKAEIRAIKRTPPILSFYIKAKCLENLKVGDSIAIDGACLTITEIGKTGFSVDVVPETIERSTLGSFRVGRMVNLEKALSSDGRLSGHIVTGHVDGIGVIKRKVKKGNVFELEVEFQVALSKYIVTKGSIAVDGISLTISKVSGKKFTVAIVPHTADVTTLGSKRVGDKLNLEVDIIGKYIQQQLKTKALNLPAEASGKIIDEEYLKNIGFMR